VVPPAPLSVGAVMVSIGPTTLTIGGSGGVSAIGSGVRGVRSGIAVGSGGGAIRGVARGRGVAPVAAVVSAGGAVGGAVVEVVLAWEQSGGERGVDTVRLATTLGTAARWGVGVIVVGRKES